MGKEARSLMREQKPPGQLEISADARRLRKKGASVRNGDEKNRKWGDAER